jgi:hypothetical protein
MDKYDFIFIGLFLTTIGLFIWAGTSLDKSGKDACEKMMALAETRQDSLNVYIAKPSSKMITCMERLN